MYVEADVYGYGVEMREEADNAVQLCCVNGNWYWSLGSTNVFKKTSREEIENSIFYGGMFNDDDAVFEFELVFNDEFGGFLYKEGGNPDFIHFNKKIEIEPEK